MDPGVSADSNLSMEMTSLSGFLQKHLLPKVYACEHLYGASMRHSYMLLWICRVEQIMGLEDSVDAFMFGLLYLKTVVPFEISAIVISPCMHASDIRTVRPVRHRGQLTCLAASH